MLAVSCAVILVACFHTGLSRYCLKQLGVVDERDYKSLVIRVFWRWVPIIISDTPELISLKVHTSHARSPVYILA